MKNILLTTVILLMAPSAIADDCVCTIFPFKPEIPCWATCTAKVIATANEEELQLFIGLDESLSKSVMKISKTAKTGSLESYEKGLTQEEFKALTKRLGALNSLQIAYFQKPAAQRADIRVRMTALLAK